MILPTQWYEGFPMSIAEAFSVGTPVLVSDLGNAGSLVETGKTGLKFQAADPDSIAEAVRAFWQRRQEPGWYESARQEYEHTMAPEENYRQLLAIYEKAMEARR